MVRRIGYIHIHGWEIGYLATLWDFTYLLSIYFVF